MSESDAMLERLDHWYGPRMEVVCISPSPSGRYYARLACGHTVRTAFLTNKDLERARALERPIERHCHYCRDKAERKTKA